MKVIETIGNTKLVQLQHIGDGRIYVKVEKTNPGGSIKDRPAYYMIRDAIERGDLKPGMTIVEPTSGNTGIALALIGKQLGYPVELFMPASMSKERVRLMQSFGAKVTLTTEGALQGAVDAAKKRVAEGNAYMPDQFTNPSNPKAHYETTGPEIYEALPDAVAFVSGFGTGGTISGVGRFLKEHIQGFRVFGLEPKESPLVSEGHAGSHKIQGISGNFVPKNLDKSILDGIYSVASDDAIAMSRRLAAEEGLSVGISSGANVVAALQALNDVEGKVVTVLPDLGERYMSTALFEED